MRTLSGAPTIFTVILTLALFLFGALGASGCDELTIDLSIDKSRVQERAAERFPIEQELDLANMTLSNPIIDFDAGPDRIGLSSDVKIQRPNIPIAILGKARASGKVRYEPKDATFYMTDIKIESIDLPMKLASEKRKQRMTDLVNAAVQKKLQEIPLDTLQNKSAEEAAKVLIKSVSIKGDKLIIKMGLGKK